MKLKYSRRIILCAVLVISALSCQFLPLKVERTTTADQIYSFDPSTILQSLTQGNADVFSLLPETSQTIPNLEYTPVTWKQKDYLFIAQTFHKFLRDESLDSWKLNDMTLRLECKDVSSGLQLGSFKFSKVIYEQEIPHRWVRYITIDPMQSEILFTEEEYHPVGYFTGMAEWSSVDLTQMKISAEDAIQIAENAGGAKIRRDAVNNCGIFETFDVEGTNHQNDWVVTYSAHDEHFTTLLEVVVNGFTGEYKTVR